MDSVLDFTKGKSCLAFLVKFYQVMSDGVEVGKAVYIGYLDLGKAVDCVFHKVLIKKLVDVWVDRADSEGRLIHQRTVLTYRDTLTGWRNGLTYLHETMKFGNKLFNLFYQCKD